jgi:glycosyltransferase involved in cell wall biosynthesis
MKNLLAHILSPDYSQVQFQPQLQPNFNAAAQKVAILATSEFEGFYKNGGIGTYYQALSQHLAADGWSIILLLCQNDTEFGGKSQLPNLQHIFSTGEVDKVLNLQPIHRAILAQSQEQTIAQWFDYESFCCLFFTQAILASFPEAVVYVEFPAIWGFGDRTIQAKKSGVLPNRCLIGVTDHGGFEWLRETNHRYAVDHPHWFWQAYHYEQYSYENADVTYFPSHFLKSKVESYGWKTSHAIHLPYFIPIVNLAAKNSTLLDPPQPPLNKGGDRKSNLNVGVGAIRESPLHQKITLVFFGRLEERKGLCTFVEAIQSLDPKMADKLEIIFLGKIVQLESTQLKGWDSQEYLDRALKGNYTYQILPELSSQQAIEFVSQLLNPIVCLCSWQENFPNAALEMGQLPVSLVVSDTGGFRETLDLVSRTDGLRWFQPTDAQSLADCIIAAISARPETPAIPDRPDLEKTNQTLLDRRLESMSEAFMKSAPKQPKNSRVTVGVTCFADAEKILDCLESLTGQTYDNLEVIVLYQLPASEPIPEAIAQAKTQYPNYQFIASNNQSLGAAYNQLVQLATGEYFLQLASDRIALPTMVEKLVNAAGESDAIAVVCADMKLGQNLPDLPDLQVINCHDGSLLKLLEFNQPQDLCALFTVEWLREFPYCEVRDLLGLNWQILAAAIATGQEIAYYPYPLYLSDTDSALMIPPENLPKERYYLRQYISQIEVSRWTQRQLHLLLTCVEQLCQSEMQHKNQIWQLQQNQTQGKIFAAQSQAWMQTALQTQDELEALQAKLQKH